VSTAAAGALLFLLALSEETSFVTWSAAAVAHRVAYFTQGHAIASVGVRRQARPELPDGTVVQLANAMRSATGTGLHQAFEGLIDTYLQPWLPSEERKERVISTDMFDYVERHFFGMGIRVRVFHGRVFFRNVYAYEQPFYYSRMRFHLNIIQDAVKHFQVNDTEFFVNLADGPWAGIDTSAPIPGFPIFGHVSSDVHIDIGIPDSMEYGAYSKYTTDSIPLIPWENKDARLFFRGASTNFDMAAHNWHVSPRVRAAKLSAARADGMMDAGISRWSHVRNPNTNSGDNWRLSTAQEIESDTGVLLAPQTALGDQCLAKWLLLLDGGWGGSRRAAILRCGSVLVQQMSPWRAFYSPLLVEGEHYVRVDRHLRNLTVVTEWLANHDDDAQRIAANGKQFADMYLTRDAAVEYWGLLLQRWTTLLTEGQNFEPSDVEWDHCSETAIQRNPRKSVMNCSKGWQTFASFEDFDAMYEGTPAVS